MKRFLFARLEVWVFCLFLLLGILGLIAFGGLVLLRERGSSFAGVIGEGAHSVAEIPLIVKRLTEPDERIYRWAKRFDAIPSGWSSGDGGWPDGLAGYILLSRVDGDRQRVTVELVDLRDFSIKHTWLPDADELFGDISTPPPGSAPENWTLSRFRSVHPLVTSDGDLQVKDHFSPLFGIDACSRPLWSLEDIVYSHSSETGPSGDVWVPAHPASAPDSRWPETYRNDSLARLTEDGKLVENLSLTDIFINHGLFGRLFPEAGYHDDPLHLNDIQPVLKDGPYWKKGDLFLSLRGPSIVMLYRPSSGEIIWMKEGPWLKQHDVDILDDHRISVFSNNTRDYGDGPRVDKNVDVMIYDFSTGELSTPWQDAFELYDIETTFEGLADLLPGGSLMVEETNSGRLLILDEDGAIRAQFLNRARDGQVYVMAWSRYIEPSVGDALVKVLEKVNCNG